MKKKIVFTLLGGWFVCFTLGAQPQWDDPTAHQWGSEYRVVEIVSSADGSKQKAIFRPTRSSKSQPLIVCFHTWSGDYRQKDPLEKDIVEKDYNFIFPDIRGANDKPEACGSPLVIADMEDAVRFAMANGRVDPKEVHVIGASGGGYATLLAYMKLSYPVKSFSAWVPISDLEAWYWESVGRKQKYADHIYKATQSGTTFNVEEAHRRSPIYMPYPKALRKDAKLYLYAGVHDGYTGSVPTVHSMRMYNYIARAQGANKGALISDGEMLELVTKRMLPNADVGQRIGDRQIYLKRSYKNVQIVLFDGGHERLSKVNMALMPIRVQGGG